MIVTGGSRGIGAATARLGAQRGYAVCVNYRSDRPAAVKRMSKRHGGQGGAIVNLSSAAARLGSPGDYVDYAASKGAIDTFTVGLAKEVAADGIRVNAVRPGVIHTGIHAQSGDPGRVARIAESAPLKRGGQPEEVARAILWLLSADASHPTRSLIDVTGIHLPIHYRH